MKKQKGILPVKRILAVYALMGIGVGMKIDLTLLIQYRRKISREIFAAMLSYLLLPLLAAVFLLFYYGISLVNIAISISVVLMFVTATMEQNQNLAKKEHCLK